MLRRQPRRMVRQAEEGAGGSDVAAADHRGGERREGILRQPLGQRQTQALAREAGLVRLLPVMRREPLDDPPRQRQHHGGSHEVGAEREQVLPRRDLVQRRGGESLCLCVVRPMHGVGRQRQQPRQRTRRALPGQRPERRQPLGPPPSALRRTDVEHGPAADGAPAGGVAKDEAVAAEKRERPVGHHLRQPLLAGPDAVGRERHDPRRPCPAPAWRCAADQRRSGFASWEESLTSASKRCVGRWSSGAISMSPRWIASRGTPARLTAARSPTPATSTGLFWACSPRTRASRPEGEAGGCRRCGACRRGCCR